MGMELDGDHHRRGRLRLFRRKPRRCRWRAGPHQHVAGRLLLLRGRVAQPDRPAHERRSRLGDKVEVTVVRVDLQRRQLDFRVLDVRHDTSRERKRSE